MKTENLMSFSVPGGLYSELCGGGEPRTQAAKAQSINLHPRLQEQLRVSSPNAVRPTLHLWFLWLLCVF